MGVNYFLIQWHLTDNSQTMNPMGQKILLVDPRYVVF